MISRLDLGRSLAALALVSWGAPGLLAQQTAAWREWNQPLPPFRIAGPVYYVGMAQVTSLLVTTPAGHVLIDGDFPESAPRILQNVEDLGFAPRDVRILLSTHAHIDHAGGLAELKARTHARLYAGAADASALARGGRQDFAFGDDLAFPPVSVDVAVEDGEEVTLGGISFRAIATPGHTRGCTSWAFTIHEQDRALRVLVVGGTTAPGYTLVANPKYPSIAADFERTFARLEAERPDIFVEGHGFLFALDDKRAGRRSFVDPEGYVASVARAKSAFRKQLEEQKRKASARQ